MLYSSLDLMIAIPALLITLVFFPRIVMFIIMRKWKSDYKKRLLAYRVRMTTTLLHIALNLCCIIGLIIMLVKASGLIFFVNVPGIVVYILILVWILAADIYYSCVFNRYYKKKADKTPGHG